VPLLIKLCGGKLIPTKVGYRVYEYGNFPLRSDGKPKGGIYRMVLPADADWSKREDLDNKFEEEAA
jgi:hypothetical protein